MIPSAVKVVAPQVGVMNYDHPLDPKKVLATRRPRPGIPPGRGLE
jgi:hypothetical protein